MKVGVDLAGKIGVQWNNIGFMIISLIIITIAVEVFGLR